MENGEFFFGATLDKAGASATWNSHEAEDEEGHQSPPCKLYIKQVLLSHTAKEGEYNVVEVEAMNELSDMMKIPVAVLRVGETRSIMTNLEFPDAPVTFKLVEGSGPVYILGNQAPMYTEHCEEGVVDEAELIEEEHEHEQEEEVKPPSKKRKLPDHSAKAEAKGEKTANGSSNNQKNSKKSAK